MTLGRQTRKIAALGVAAAIVAGSLTSCDTMRGHSTPQSQTQSYRVVTDEAGAPGLVVAVIDGDTIKVKTGDHVQRVRVLGINAPELAHDGKPAQCGGEAARTALDRMIYRKTVALQRDPRSDDVDRYGRLLRYVSLDGTDVGLAMIRSGHASEYHPRSATAEARAAKYRTAQAAVEAAKRGQWASCTPAQETKQ